MSAAITADAVTREDQFDEWGDPRCNISGECVAFAEDRDRGISMCQFCGKQMELIGGRWWTWDVADDVRAGDASRALPQREEDTL